jgi:zinc protease
VKKMTDPDLAIPIGPDSIARRIFANGLVALARENHSSPAVVISGLIRAGSVHEPAELAGLAAFTAECLTRGTERRTFAQINEEVEAVGASLGTGSGLNTSTFGAKCLADDLGLVLDVLADVLRHPTFPAEEVEKVRGEILTGLEERDNDTGSVADRVFRELAYPAGHPYGRPPEGDPPTVAAIMRDDLARFYAERYGPQGGIVVVVGAVKADEALDRLEEALGDWTGGPSAGNRDRLPLPPVTLPTEVRRRVVDMPGKSQADIVLGLPGPRRADPDYLDAALANLILGGFGMMGRLGKNVRDEQGLAYYVYSRMEGGLGPGPWVAVAGVNPRNVEAALAGILREIERLRGTPVDDQERDDAISYLIGSLPLHLETNEGMAQAILEMELFELGLDYLQRFPGLVRAITAGQVQAAALKYLNPAAYALAIAGPPMEGADR